MTDPKQDLPTPDEFIALRRRRNFAVFGAIVLLCVIFYLITIVRLGVA
ncbi:MAG: hypothetical protein J4F41_00310 [Alphaproteobacteria bacterium]|nr:hypothetical protein [Alphaproteobacteria bacterium]